MAVYRFVVARAARLQFAVLLTAVLLFALPMVAGAAEGVFSVRGIGGGGGIFSPSVSPFDRDFMLVGSDMSGVYYSHDGGKDWSLVRSDNIRDVAGSGPPAYFHDRVYWYSRLSPMVSEDKGRTWRNVPWPWKPRRHIVGMTAVTPARGMADRAGQPDRADRADSAEKADWAAVPGGKRYLFVATREDLWRCDIDKDRWDMVLEGDCLPPIVLDDVLMVMSGGRMMRSDDAGESWHPVNAPIEAEGEMQALAGSHDGEHALLLATVKDRGVFRSVDYGANWQQVADYAHQVIIRIPGGQTRVAWMMEIDGIRGKRLWKSADGGSRWAEVFRYSGLRQNVTYSWVQTQMRWGYFFTNNGFYASMADPDMALVTTQGDFYITRDGGDSWNFLINRPMGMLADGKTPRFASVGLEMTTCFQYLIDPWEPERHYVAFTDIGFIRSEDGGRTWSYAAKGSPWPNTFYRVRFDPQVPGKMYAAAANRHDIPNWSQLAGWNKAWNIGGVVVSSDFGATWAPLKGLPELPCTDVIIHMDALTGSRVLYATVYGGGVFVSRDGGVVWRNITANMDPKNMHALRLWRNAQNGNLYCLVTARRDVMGGKNVMTPGGLWKSQDDGLSWTNLMQGTPVIWPTAFVVDPADEGRIFVAVASVPGNKPHFGGLWRTEDGGRRWEHVFKVSDTRWSYDRMMAVALHPDDASLVYAGGAQTGLWISRDRGGTWRNAESFPFASVQGIDFHPADASQMFLTTFGAGVWAGPHLPE